MCSALFFAAVPRVQWACLRGADKCVPRLLLSFSAIIHGTLPWTNPKTERRSLMYRYMPKYLHFAGGTFETAQPEWVSELTPAQQAVLEPPYIYNRPLIGNSGEILTPRVG